MPYVQVMPKQEVTATIVGGVTINPRTWKVQEIANFTLNGGEVITKTFTNTIGLDIIVSRLNISTQGASAIIILRLPAPHQPETRQSGATIPDIHFDYGEGIIVNNGEVINIDFTSQDSEAQQIKITYLWTPK